MLKRAFLGVPFVLAAIWVAATWAGGSSATQAQPKRVAHATFAGGCFWCMEPPFDEIDGVLSTTSGYTGGKVQNPNYAQVSAGGTGHYEVVRIAYDPAKVSFETLVDVFWKNIDPLDPTGQFCDKGSQYLSAIFYETDEQLKIAGASKAALEKSGRFRKPIVTGILPASTFYPAEEYHQDYYRQNPVRYKFYRTGCGRDRRLRELWK